MARRIIYIIIGALLILALIIGLWFWFFGRSTTPATNTGSFGEGGNRPGSGLNTGANGGNGQSPLGSTAGSNSNIGVGSGSTGGGTNTQTPLSPLTQITPGSSTNSSYFTPLPDTNPSSDVVWNTGGTGSTQNILFNPTPINSINTNEVYGNPYLRTPVIGPDGKEVSLLGGLGVVLGGCILSYSTNLAATQFGTALQRLFLSPDALKVQVAAQSTNNSVGATSVRDCLIRTLGKMAVQSITDSTINWINSGFNGKPAFVQDFRQFFAGVADQAAGEFLKASNFAFLCSPFQLQVRIAIAQSYARRTSGGTGASCTLSQAVGNVESFLNGNFNEGGWRGLISFTTTEANNPFTAYMTLKERLNFEIDKKQGIATLEVNLGDGFLSFKKCDPNPGFGNQNVYDAAATPGQNCKIVTPGSLIDEAGAKALGQSFDQLEIGESIDQILQALTNALLTKALYGGLANVGKNTAQASTGLTPQQQQANALMDELRGSVTAAQQYATIEQRTIVDIQTAQQNLVTLQNCWLQASSSPTLTPAQVATAQAGVGAAAAKVAELQLQVDLHNQRIIAANTTISRIQELQTDLLLATVSSDVTRVKTEWTAIKSSNQPRVYTNTDITTAQQDRTSAQNNLASLNIETSTKLQQCYALGG